MRDKALVDRIKRLQKHLEINVDGVVGSDTLTAIENRLLDKAAIAGDYYSLTVSRVGLDQLIGHEVVSKKYYSRYLKIPVWPGGGSGVTIGIGYDLGYNRPAQIRKDWQGKIPDVSLDKLLAVSGLKGEDAKKALTRIRKVTINFDAASDVFSESALPRYAKSTRKVFPGVEDMFPDAQAGLLSLVYNRGTSMRGARRKEMAAIKPLVLDQDYAGIAHQLRSMKRLWEGAGLAGLLKRRDDEADLVLNADRKYAEASLIRI